MSEELTGIEEEALSAAHHAAKGICGEGIDAREYVNVCAHVYVEKCVCSGALPISELPQLKLIPARRVVLIAS